MSLVVTNNGIIWNGILLGPGVLSYLRNATGQGRLTGLALLSVHRDIDIDPQHVIAELARQPRRLNFIL